MTSAPEDRPEHAFAKTAEAADLLGVDNFRHLAESLPQIVWTANPSGVIDYMGPQFSRFTGVPMDNPDYLNWEPRIHPDDLAALMQRWGESVASGEVLEHEFRMRSSDDTYFWFSTRAVPVVGSDGGLVKWYGTTNNIEQLKRASEEKDKFIAMLGHELRNPLAAISNSYLALDHGELTSEQMSTALSLLGRQIDHLSRLVDDTLDISRLSSGKLRLITSKLELNQLVKDSVGDVQRRGEESALKIRAELVEEPIWVDGDGVRLAQCLSNLLSNSMKFTEPGGEIIVSVEADADRDFAMIKVRDTGIGMTPAEIDLVFEPFRQGSSAQQLSKDGLGLGLAVIQEIIRLHGGKVSATSGGKGKGATFMLNLPLSKAPQPSETTPVENPRKNPGARILIVEDNENVAETLELYFKVKGHSVTLAVDGESALAALDQEIPDIVFCDLTLPGSLKGWDIAEQIRASYPEDQMPYLVALSGHAQPHHIEKSLKSGFDEHLSKPPQPDQLSAAIQAALVKKPLTSFEDSVFSKEKSAHRAP